MLFVVGLNHHQSPLEIRERYTPGDRLPALLTSLGTLEGIHELFVLSTCNRTEIYCLLESHIQTFALDEVSTPASLLSLYHGIRGVWEQTLDITPVQSKEASLFHVAGRAAYEHLAKVAAGLEAMILGEPQILGQVKSAYKQAQDLDACGPGMQKVLNPLFELVKKVRTTTEIGHSPVSFASATFQLAEQIFSDAKKSRILFIGAGEMIELVCRHFYHNGVKNITVANRSLERINPMISDFGVKAHTLDELASLLPHADIIVASTGSREALVNKKDVSHALKERRHQPMLFVDLAVPRDIAANVSDLDNAFVYTVDDIHQVISKHQAQRLTAAEEAHRIIQDGVEHILHQQRIQHFAPVIQEYREEAEKIRVDVLAEARRRLMKGDDQYEVLDALSKMLMKRLIHHPTKGLRTIASEGGDTDISLAKQLLGLQSPQEH